MMRCTGLRFDIVNTSTSLVFDEKCALAPDKWFRELRCATPASVGAADWVGGSKP
jgi:hypothetical protein